VRILYFSIYNRITNFIAKTLLFYFSMDDSYPIIPLLRSTLLPTIPSSAADQEIALDVSYLFDETFKLLFGSTNFHEIGILCLAFGVRWVYSGTSTFSVTFISYI